MATEDVKLNITIDQPDSRIVFARIHDVVYYQEHGPIGGIRKGNLIRVGEDTFLVTQVSFTMLRTVVYGYSIKDKKYTLELTLSSDTEVFIGVKDPEPKWKVLGTMSLDGVSMIDIHDIKGSEGGLTLTHFQEKGGGKISIFVPRDTFYQIFQGQKPYGGICDVCHEPLDMGMTLMHYGSRAYHPKCWLNKRATQ